MTPEDLEKLLKKLSRRRTRNVKVVLSGTSPSWNFYSANIAEITLTGATSLTLSGTSETSMGFLRIIGDGTHTITLPGVLADGLIILTGIGDVTDLTFVQLDGVIYWSLSAKYTGAITTTTTTTTTTSTSTTTTTTATPTTTTTSSSSTTTTTLNNVNITFAAANTDLLNTAQVFTSPGGGSSFGNTGLDAKKLASGVSGRIWSKFIDTNSENCVIGFNTVNAEAQYNQMEAAIFFANGPTTLKRVDGGAPQVTSYGTPVANHYYGIYRNGSTGELKIQESSDEINWSDVVGPAFTFTSTADLFIVCDISGSNILTNPKGNNIA